MFGHVQRRPIDEKFVFFFFLCQVDSPSWKNGRLKSTWMEVVKIDLEKCNLHEDLAPHRLKFRNRIHVAEFNIVVTRL